MVKLRSTVEIRPIDLSEVPAVVRCVLDRCRGLSFQSGAAIHPSTGVRLEGLSNVSGSHPRVGSEYKIVTSSEELPSMNADDRAAFEALDHKDRAAFQRGLLDLGEKRWAKARSSGRVRTVHDVSTARLVADDRKRVAFDISSTEPTPFTTSVRIEPPDRPNAAYLDVVAAVGGHWLVSGDAQLDIHVDIETLTRIHANPATIVSASARHRRGRGSIHVSVTEAAPSTWKVEVVGRARGAGWFRPIAAIIAVVARRRLQRWLDNALQPDSDLETEIRTAVAHIADSSPDAVAIELIDDLLDGVVETLGGPTALRPI